MTKGKPVHTRKVEINAFDVGDHQVLVDGELLDTRPVGSIHHLFARIRVQGPDLTITHVDAEMKRIPREGCPEALPAVQKLSGLRIISGYTQRRLCQLCRSRHRDKPNRNMKIRLVPK